MNADNNTVQPPNNQHHTCRFCSTQVASHDDMYRHLSECPYTVDGLRVSYTTHQNKRMIKFQLQESDDGKYFWCPKCHEKNLKVLGASWTADGAFRCLRCDYGLHNIISAYSLADLMGLCPEGHALENPGEDRCTVCEADKYADEFGFIYGNEGEDE